MAFEWNFAAAISDIKDLAARVTTAFLSMTDVRTEIKGFPLGAGSNPVRHGRRSVPRQVAVVIVGNTASTAIVTRGAMDRDLVWLHSTAPCVVDLVIYGSPS